MAELEEIVGRVIRRPFALGSKSERVAIILQSEGRNDLVLRLQGGNAFYDPALDAFVGRTVRCKGRVHGYTFIAVDCQIIE